MAELMLKYNGRLPSNEETIAAFLSPHTADMMVDRLEDIGGGAAVAGAAWEQIEQEVVKVICAEIDETKQSAKAPTAAGHHCHCTAACPR